MPLTVLSSDTIFALSSAPGKAGVAVVRVSGPSAPASALALGVTLPAPRKATRAPLLTADGAPLDDALMLFFPAPHSFTGEDVVEYHVHGGKSILRALSGILSTLPGTRHAQPGEFTQRAFLHGKLDLTAAEGLFDIINADTETQRRQAMRLYHGETAHAYDALREHAIRALALFEAYIDFPEEDIPETVRHEADALVLDLVHSIRTRLDTPGGYDTIRDGIEVAIIGPPNVGKSALLNRLARKDAAIVSPYAGTTRDVIEVPLDIGGYAVTLCDTAGMREAGDSVEQEGIRRSHARAKHADLTLLMLDPDSYARARETPQAFPFDEFADARCLLLLNKIDQGLPDALLPVYGLTPLLVSVQQGSGFEALSQALLMQLERYFPSTPPFIVLERHRAHLLAAQDILAEYDAAPLEMLEIRCEILRRAAQEIGKITGKIYADEVLGRIFSSFCIGK